MSALPWLTAMGFILTLAVATATPEGPASPGRVKRSSILFPGQAPKPKETLDLPDDMDLNKLDSTGLNKINSINNVEDFAKLFNISLPAEFADLAVRVGSGSQSKPATMADCEPEVQTVSLDLPVEASTLYYPTCVRVKQCGGCCFGPLVTCLPTATKKTEVKVLKTAVTTSTRRTGGTQGNRRRRQTDQTYETVTVVEHEACKCGCKVQEQDCNSKIHTYKEAECACVCKNKEAKAACEGQANTKYWDSDSCTCYCSRSLDCGTGEYFSQTSCACERL